MVSCIHRNLAGGLLSSDTTPLVIVKIGRRVSHRAAPVTRIERQCLLGFKTVNRDPPVNLARRAGVPDISMRAVRITDSSREIPAVRSNPQPRHIEVCISEIAAEL